MDAPLISVIMRSMARPTLERALASVALQRDVALEVLLVGASGASHPPPPGAGPHPLRFIASRVHLARAAAANAGLDAARGRWVTWLDDDDEWREGHLHALLEAATANPSAGIVHSLAEVRIAGEPARSFGQPMALSEFYRRNFVHPSTAIVDVALVHAGCRCDESLQVHEDWDWLLQCAQRARFHFLRAKTFVWYADAGNSGAGGGRNLDAATTGAATEAVRRKWASRYLQLVDSLRPVLAQAIGAFARREWTDAARAIGAALSLDSNNPDALLLLAKVERAGGRLAEAQAAVALACVVRPDDAVLVYNLALICRERGDIATARECALRLGRIAAHDPRAAALRCRLEGA